MAIVSLWFLYYNRDGFFKRQLQILTNHEYNGSLVALSDG